MPRSVTKIIIVLPGGFVKRFPGIFYPEAAKGVFVKGRSPFPASPKKKKLTIQRRIGSNNMIGKIPHSAANGRGCNNKKGGDPA